MKEGMSFQAGDAVQARVYGYTFGSKPRWIAARVVGSGETRHRVHVEFTLPGGKTLRRMFAKHNVRHVITEQALEAQ